MPTISMFYGIVIQMYWQDTTLLTFMCVMAEIRP